MAQLDPLVRGRNTPVLLIERMVRSVTRNHQGERTKVTSVCFDGTSNADPALPIAGKCGHYPGKTGRSSRLKFIFT
jgi:hypothetical protein